MSRPAGAGLAGDVARAQAAFAVLGIGHGLLGAFLIIYAAVNARRIRRALDEDRPLTGD